MPPRVFGQVVAAHEAPVADVANKLLLAGMRPTVAGKLIRAGKLFVAALPVTAERLFTCVCAQVSLQVGALEVGLLAAREVADIISSAGEVGLRGAAARSCWHVNRCWGQGEELGVAQGHDSLGALWRLGDGWLGNHEHHGALGHGGAHQQRLGEAGRRLGQDGLGPPLSLHLNRSLNEGGDHPCPAAHREDLAEDRRGDGGGGDGRGGGGGRQRGGVRR